MIQVILYTTLDEDQKLDIITKRLEDLQEEFPHQLHIIDIEGDDVLKEEYGDKTPVLDIGVYRLIETFEEKEIRFAFEKSEERLLEAKNNGNTVLVERITEPIEMSKSDRASLWFSKNYMNVLNGFLFLYVFLNFLAPSLMKIGWEAPARVIYRVYSPLCHQLAYRSFFLFGEQAYYPTQFAAREGVITYGEASGLSEDDISAARNFLGNEVMGYKTTMCQRDIAIYGALFLFGLAFSFSGRKIKPIPWYLWIIIGIGPIGLDGFSQLLGQTGLSFFAWIPFRESTPLFRVVTGALFGLASGWFGFPYLEESVLENRREMQLKHAVVSQMAEQQEKPG